MEAQEASKFISIESLYLQYSERIFNYIRSKIDNNEDAENLSQDVWMKLLERDSKISSETALSFLYKVAINIVNDYLRRLYVRDDSREEIERRYGEPISITPAQEYIAKEIAWFENYRVECLPTQRRIIYKMSRFDEMPVADIAEALSLSFRTVENHLRMGRRDVRDFITAIA